MVNAVAVRTLAVALKVTPVIAAGMFQYTEPAPLNLDHWQILASCPACMYM
jgi:hypothetical protein